MSTSRVLQVGSLFVAILGVAYLVYSRTVGGQTEWTEPYDGQERWASLSPELTEAMYAIGAGSALVGRCSQCTEPMPARRLRDLGPAAAPDRESMDGLNLTGVMGLEGQLPEGVPQPWELGWSSATEAAESVRALGDRFGVPDRAEVLAAAYEKDLTRRGEEEPTGARTILLYDVAEQQANFVARNSLHGGAVDGANLRHAVDRDFDGEPMVRLEDLLTIDPDLIVVLHPTSVSTEQREQILAPLRAIGGLRAAESGAIDVVGAPGLLGVGPSMLKLPTLLRERASDLVPAKTP